MNSSKTSIEVDAQTARAISEQAASFGLSVENYLKRHFAGFPAPESLEDADRWLDELVEGLPPLPQLPDDFSSRDVYAEHD